MTMHPALALIEVRSIARGLVVTDAIVKKAAVELLRASPISPGRYITLFWGSVGEVEEACTEGLSRSGDFLVDHLILPGAQYSRQESGLSRPGVLWALPHEVSEVRCRGGNDFDVDALLRGQHGPSTICGCLDIRQGS